MLKKFFWLTPFIFFCFFFTYISAEEAVPIETENGANKKIGAIILTDENFEHLTQANSGATTGDWFVMFYAPWCGHCQNLKPTWEQLANNLHGQVNIAKVDVTKNPGLLRRFTIPGYPTLLFFHQGTLYRYKSSRALDHLEQFALSGYKDTEGVPVPGIPTIIDDVKLYLRFLKHDFKFILYEAKLAGAILILVSFIIGFITHGYFISTPALSPPSSSKRTVSGRVKKDL